MTRIREIVRVWKMIWQSAVIACLFLAAACSNTPLKAPEPVVDHKALCELKTSILVTAANQAGLTCKQVKPALDMILSLDPDCREYFGKTEVAVDCK